MKRTTRTRAFHLGHVGAVGFGGLLALGLACGVSDDAAESKAAPVSATESSSASSNAAAEASAEHAASQTTGKSSSPMLSATLGMAMQPGGPMGTAAGSGAIGTARPMNTGRPSPFPSLSAMPGASGSGAPGSVSSAPAMSSVMPQPSASTPVGGGSEVAATEYCAPVADWDAAWTKWEEDVLELVNAYRAMGYNCDTEGMFAAAPPLKMDPVLRCSARLHSLDMFQRGFFAHENPDGLDPNERMIAAGFKGMMSGENIAMGQTSPETVMMAWMDSDGHCSNIMQPKFELIGIGYHPGSANDFKKQRYWTQNFGTPFKKGTSAKP